MYLCDSGAQYSDGTTDITRTVHFGKPSEHEERCYTAGVSKGGLKGIAHITGGGLTNNVPHVFPQGLGARIYNNFWSVLPIFKWIQKDENIEDAEMKRTFNMGIRMLAKRLPKGKRWQLKVHFGTPVGV
ncbi:putative phosphoribosylformylglycinamidine cyclo-ligase [Helianthus annuus]|nr:putative phosphoribosylformylglycinamidine cyclo-ligase [Helianthus annuus]